MRTPILPTRILLLAGVAASVIPTSAFAQQADPEAEQDIAAHSPDVGDPPSSVGTPTGP